MFVSSLLQPNQCKLTCLFVATQLVILTPHIPYRGQGGGILLLRYSMICVLACLSNMLK